MNTGKNYIFFFGLFLLQMFCSGQKGPVARFSFNNCSPFDAVSGYTARLANVGFTEDRFGNRDHAIFLPGNVYSYVNLGSSSALKPGSGTISIWISMEVPVWSGMGHKVNPILLTKSTERDDFYEAYAIYYMLESGRLVAVFSQDSIGERGAFGKKIMPSRWHHLLITYDYNFGSLYVDGELEMKMPKKFATTFLESDSVMIGNTANKKNSRYFNGAVDDIEFYDRVLTEQEIRDLYHAPDPHYGKKRVWFWFWRCGVMAGIILALYFTIRYRLKKEIIKKQQQLELANMVLETELRVNRALMNPHFVFNSLNSLQNFIMSKDYIQANGYLVKFSKLMRKLLESNISNMVSLEQEIGLLTTYMELEDVRFEKGITYAIEVEPNLVPAALEIPVMMLQPFIENAIWHGLLKKAGEKLLKVSFSKAGNDYLQCTIEDNGIGREKAAMRKTKTKSFAIIFVRQRLDLLNKIHHLNCTLTITDKPGGEGTLVTILLPILKKQNDVTRNNH